LTSAEVEAAVGRFDSTELAIALRQGWFVIDRHNGVPLCAVADRQAERACSKAGFKATAGVNRQVLIDTISSTYADSIADKASNALSQMYPGLSASRVVTPVQTVFGCMLLAAGGVFAWHFADAFRFMLVVMFSMLFVAVGCLKLASVFVHGKAILPDKVELSDAELPVYTVLVPLFRETGILRQTINALKFLNYPALGSKCTTTLIPDQIPHRYM
jgi:hypothetical protein